MAALTVLTWAAYPLVNSKFDIEHGHVWLTYPLKFLIFHSYVDLPGGIHIQKLKLFVHLPVFDPMVLTLLNQPRWSPCPEGQDFPIFPHQPMTPTSRRWFRYHRRSPARAWVRPAWESRNAGCIPNPLKIAHEFSLKPSLVKRELSIATFDYQVWSA